MDQYGQKSFWTKSKVLLIIGLIIILLVIYLFNRESIDLPKLIKQHPEETELLENTVREELTSMSQDDTNLMIELTQKAVSLLPDDEEQTLISLQIQLNEYGYNSLTENEIRTMQQLNQKAFNLLPEEDKLILANIFKKAGNNVETKIK